MKDSAQVTGLKAGNFHLDCDLFRVLTKVRVGNPTAHKGFSGPLTGEIANHAVEIFLEFHQFKKWRMALDHLLAFQ
jgi:hypothetical protein